MRGEKRPSAKRDADKLRTAELAKEGHSQKAIADKIGMSPQTVSRDLAAIRREWQESTLVAIDQLMQRELEKAITAYWQGWNDSREDGPGAWQFIHGILGAVKLRAQLLGLLPKRLEINPDPMQQLGEAMREALAHTETQAQQSHKRTVRHRK